MIKFILEYLFIFTSGSIIGWCIEIIYRRYFGLAKKWVNPGFLSGPYLPLYGSASCVLYIVCELNISFIIKVIAFALVTTLFEYITGLFFLKIYNIRLWDYRGLKYNFQGLVAPLYSVFWTILSLVFYFILYPYFYKKVLFLYENLEFSLLIGIILGVMLVDVIQSFNVVKRLHEFGEQLEESRVVIEYEKLKCEIRERFNESPIKVNFLFPFKGEINLRKLVKEHIEQIKEKANLRLK